MSELRAAVAAFVGARLGRNVELTTFELLAGGASHEAWAVHVAEPALRLVLRRSMGGSFHSLMLDREAEFAVIEGAFRAGVAVAKPYWYAPDLAGRPGFFVERVDGETVGRRIVTAPELAAVRALLPEQLGRIAAQIHALEPASLGLTLPQAGTSHARREIDRLAAELDGLDEGHPALELGLRWLRAHEPRAYGTTVIHGDYRIGNVILGGEGVRAVLDWEFTRVGDPMADLGWICVRSWRFGNDRLRVGGIGELEPFLGAYEAASGRKVDPRDVYFWEVFGNVGWAIGAFGQARRHLSGAEPSIELASLGRVGAEMEYELLHLIGAAA